MTQPYFQAYLVMVLIDQLLKSIMMRLDTSGHMENLVIELGKYDVNYWQQPAIKAQVLANFLIEGASRMMSQLEQSQGVCRRFLMDPACRRGFKLPKKWDWAHPCKPR